MTNTWHRYANYRLQADDFIKYFDDLLSKKDLVTAKWAMDWHPYVESVLAIYGHAKIDELKENLKNAVDKSGVL